MRKRHASQYANFGSLQQYKAMHTLSQKLNKLLSDRAELDLSLARNLQKSILQEAIQGKLVPQIADEGTAEKLLAEIRKEKERLIKEGKLKKSALSDSIIYKGDDNKYSTIRKIVLFTHIYTYCPSFLLECRSNEQSAYLLFFELFLVYFHNNNSFMVLHC